MTVLEANAGVGGTWYRNRYPGCRFDSESYWYGYSFPRELLEEWNWSGHFATQPETLRYVEYVADKFELHRHIHFNTTVASAIWDEQDCFWPVRAADGREFTTRFLLTALGVLSAPTLPRYEGVDGFQGESFHTFYWPEEGVRLEGKRVAVIGTGPTGVQVISTIADKVADLTVFQRRPNWAAPLRNRPIRPDEMERIKKSYGGIFEQCRKSPAGFIHTPLNRDTFDVPKAERLAFWEYLYQSPGFGIWLGNYLDTLLDETANAELSAFMADKIRSRVDDPDLAEKLIPKDHGFGTQRVPLETNYYEAYNRDNVHLVDLSETPIERITPKGIATSEREYRFDIIVYATGFDAVTGAFDRIDFVGTDGVHLRDKWKDGPLSCLGIQTTRFPNLFMLQGPQSGSGASNFPRGIEDIVDWTTRFAAFLRDNGYLRVEPDAEAEAEWVEHVKDMAGKEPGGPAQEGLVHRPQHQHRPGRQAAPPDLHRGNHPLPATAR